MSVGVGVGVTGGEQVLPHELIDSAITKQSTNGAPEHSTKPGYESEPETAQAVLPAPPSPPPVTVIEFDVPSQLV